LDLEVPSLFTHIIAFLPSESSSMKDPVLKSSLGGLSSDIKLPSPFTLTFPSVPQQDNV